MMIILPGTWMRCHSINTEWLEFKSSDLLSLSIPRNSIFWSKLQSVGPIELLAHVRTASLTSGRYSIIAYYRPRVQYCRRFLEMFHECISTASNLESPDRCQSISDWFGVVWSPRFTTSVNKSPHCFSYRGVRPWSTSCNMSTIGGVTACRTDIAIVFNK